ncbi:MAG: tetratricopeptide repeat protein, partial [Thermoplasmata archaeon]
RQGASDRDLWTSRAKAAEAAGDKEEAVRSYLKALEIDTKDKVAWFRLGQLYAEMESLTEANDCFDRSLDIDESNSKVWMSKGATMEKLDAHEEAASAYDRAIGLDSNDKEAWKSKAYAMLKLRRPEQALRCFDHALTIDPYFETAAEGRTLAEDEIRKTKIEDYSRSVLDFEYTHGRPVTKEEAFRVCGIPYAFLGEVLDYLSQLEDISLSQLTPEGFNKYEKMSREILVTSMLKRDLSTHGLRLCDVTVNFPELRVSSAKRMLSYLKAVEEHSFSTQVSDPQTDTLLRQALDLPGDQKSVLGIIRNLEVGAYQARQLVTILMTFQEGGVESQTVTLKSIVSEGFGEYSPWESSAAKPSRSEAPRQRRHHEEEPDADEEQMEADDEPEERPVRKRPRTGTKGTPRRGSRGADAAEGDEEDEEGGADEAPSDLVGRRCLFHGGIAVKRCAKCKAVLCKECIRGTDKCPRCNAPLKGRVGRKKPARNEEPDEEEVEEEEAAPKPRKK